MVKLVKILTARVLEFLSWASIIPFIPGSCGYNQNFNARTAANCGIPCVEGISLKLIAGGPLP